MGIYLNPGNVGFKEIRNRGYVDKTGLIALMNDRIRTPEKLVCVSRARRFGKSYAAQMLCAYYDISCDSHELFDDLEIAQDESYGRHLNQYHVIYLDITTIIGLAGKENVVNYIKDHLKAELGDAYPDLKGDEDFVTLMLRIVEKTDRQFVMLIDEWDALIREAPQQQDEYLKFLRTLFEGSGTTAKIFAAAYMTGILPIKKDGSQSAISEFKEFTMLKPRVFGSYVGFTEEEVQRLCETYHSDFEKMKQWYDGYTIKGVGSVYNPNSVMEAIRNEDFDSYWRKTSAAEVLLTYVDMDVEGLQNDILDLIGGKLVQVNTRFFQNDFHSFSDKNDVLTLLIHLGYLSYEEESNGSGVVRIPNEEIRCEFRDMLHRGKHPALLRVVRMSDQLLKDTLAGNEEAVAAAIEKVRELNYAPTFYNNEQSLRYVIKMAYISSVDQYLKVEELPSGKGIADMVFLPKRYSPLPAMVVELKWNRDSEGAIAQIKKRSYPSLLEGYDRGVILVGINYDEKEKGHTCKIEKFIGFEQS